MQTESEIKEGGGGGGGGVIRVTSAPVFQISNSKMSIWQYFLSIKYRLKVATRNKVATQARLFHI